MKRSGFTMIELIFVIVILGILAAVAIPRLAATRDDAKIAAEVTSASQALQNLGAEYTSQGGFTNYTVDMANEMVQCFTFSGGGTDGNVTIASGADTGDTCSATLLAATKAKATANGLLGANGVAKTYQFGGTRIK